MSRQLFGYIGTSGDIPLTVTYPNSTIEYALAVPVSAWLREAEEPSPLRELGITPPFKLDALSLGAVAEDGAGYAAGLREGDRLVAIDGDKLFSVLKPLLAGFPPVPIAAVELLVEREGGSKAADQRDPAKLVDREGLQVGQLGVQLASLGSYPEELLRNVEYGVFGAVSRR